MPHTINLSELQKPFASDDIEWRIGQCGVMSNGNVWAKCLAYVTARAIMTRFDEVCGPENWRVSYVFIPGSTGTIPGVICQLSVFYDGQWVTKEDGAEQTDIESFKGGISSALKRAGAVWSIGRYLYGLEEGFATIVDKGDAGARYAKTKDGKAYYWIPPDLPDWALPVGNNRPSVPTPVVPQPNIGVRPVQPSSGDGNQNHDHGYRIPFGRYGKHGLHEVQLDELRNYVGYLENKAEREGKPLTGMVKEFIDRAVAHIVAIELGTADPAL